MNQVSVADPALFKAAKETCLSTEQIVELYLRKAAQSKVDALRRAWTGGTPEEKYAAVKKFVEQITMAYTMSSASLGAVILFIAMRLPEEPGQSTRDLLKIYALTEHQDVAKLYEACESDKWRRGMALLEGARVEMESPGMVRLNCEQNTLAELDAAWDVLISMLINVMVYDKSRALDTEADEAKWSALP